MEHTEALRLKAREQNWDLMLAIQTHPGGDGYVPHGVALVLRGQVPFEDRAFATVEWNVEHGDVSFMSGNYDLDIDAALADYRRRASIEDWPRLRCNLLVHEAGHLGPMPPHDRSSSA